MQNHLRITTAAELSDGLSFRKFDRTKTYSSFAYHLKKFIYIIILFRKIFEDENSKASKQPMTRTVERLKNILNGNT